MLHRTSACNWIAENEPELWKETDKYVCLSTYLNYRLHRPHCRQQREPHGEDSL